jgi:LytS/YehU family sensor histidine kinase
MNPHFLFNSLSSIHHFIIHEESEIAASYLSRFSRLIRSSLQGSVEEYTSLSDEIDTVKDYLELQQLRFPDKFEYNIEVEEDMDSETISIPSMVLQPFIENSIEHGIRPKESKGKISVRFLLHKEMIVIKIEDDGIGRKKAMELLSEQKKDHKSLATNIIRDRIRVLNRTLKNKITLEIIDLKSEQGDATGTKVVLEVPVV